MRRKQRELLLELRSKLVGQLHTQPFTIYNDDTIELLLDAQPKTIEELAKVKGFPEKGKRVQGFGEAVIAIFNDTNRIENIKISGAGKGSRISVGLKSMEAF